MVGQALMIGNCFACGKMFTFNPLRVPSFRDKNGVKQPVCGGCMTTINEKRKEMKLKPFQILPDAYEACDENELEV